jgi:hypothetical protein
MKKIPFPVFIKYGVKRKFIFPNENMIKPSVYEYISEKCELVNHVWSMRIFDEKEKNRIFEYIYPPLFPKHDIYCFGKNEFSIWMCNIYLGLYFIAFFPWQFVFPKVIINITFLLIVRILLFGNRNSCSPLYFFFHHFEQRETIVSYIPLVFTCLIWNMEKILVSRRRKATRTTFGPIWLSLSHPSYTASISPRFRIKVTQIGFWPV